MNLKISLVVALLLFWNCKEKSESATITSEELDTVESSRYLIETESLLQVVAASSMKIIDLRKPEIYSKGHIEGALNIWRPAIEDSSYAYRGMIAGKEQIEVLFGDLGISNNDTIVIYDDNGMCDATRLWWVLQNYDFTNVKLFNGGFTAWKMANGRTSMEVPQIQKTTFNLPENPSMRYMSSKENMEEAILGQTIILDTRTEDEYSGKRQKNGAMRGGRIPKSILIDWTTAINYEGNKKLKPLDELERIYERFIPSKNDTVMVYCHSGVRSAHTTFVLTQLLGYENVKNYDGSWTEWSHFENLPIEKDSSTTVKK